METRESGSEEIEKPRDRDSFMDGSDEIEKPRDRDSVMDGSDEIEKPRDRDSVMDGSDEIEKPRDRDSFMDGSEELEPGVTLNGCNDRDEVIEDETAETQIEAVYESEFENENTKSGKGGKMDEVEDTLGRHLFEIEESVAEFEDEIPTERTAIPDSSDDDSEDEIDLRDKRMRNRKHDKLAVGSSYYTVYEFKEVVLEYALTKGKNIKQDRWDKTKVSFVCGIGGKCKWRLYCSYDKDSQKWLLKTKYKYHSCTPNGKCKLLKSPVIARLFLDKLRQNANLMPEEIQNIIKEKWKIVSTRNQCQRGRLLALRWLEKEYDEQFSHLRGYAEEILFTNNGSTAIVDTYKNKDGKDVFNRFYVCFANLRDTWRGYCRPVIGVDGTFLKVAVKGVLLTAVGHDANNQIYPIAWSVVQSETTENWLWFVQQIKRDLVLKDGSGFVILSDRSKGLKSAVATELPNAEHRKCVKHIVENLKKNHAKKDLLKPMVWDIARSYSTTEFDYNVKKLKAYDLSLYNDVMKEEPRAWSRPFYRLGSCCEDVDNNATESFNSTITKARAKAMVPMLEMIRRQAMKRIAKRNIASHKHDGMRTKYVAKMLTEEKKIADLCTTTPGTRGVFEVTYEENSYSVNTIRHTCSCGKWQISGVPCEHAYGAMIDAGLNADQYVSDFFSTLMWQYTYNLNLEPVRGPRVWMKSGLPLIIAPPEPDMPGRKKKKKQKKFPRIKGKHESPKKKKKKKKEVEKLGRGGRTIHCSKCGEAGHNANGCKIHPKKKKKMSGEEV